MRIGKIGVIGAGAMGSGIAALAASAGFPVTLLDVPGDGDRNGAAKAGLQRALKAKPPQFMSVDRASLITVGNIADDLGRLAECDWIVEAIIEQPGPKRQLFEQLEAIVKPTAIVTRRGRPSRRMCALRGRARQYRATSRIAVSTSPACGRMASSRSG